MSLDARRRDPRPRRHVPPRPIVFARDDYPNVYRPRPDIMLASRMSDRSRPIERPFRKFAGDSYRPPERPSYDSYRPSYDSSRHYSPREPLSPLNGPSRSRYDRRPSTSLSRSRRHYRPPTSSRSPSRPRSRGRPSSRSCSPTRRHRRSSSRHHSRSPSRSSRGRYRRDSRSRSLSRSSIASSRISVQEQEHLKTPPPPPEPAQEMIRVDHQPPPQLVDASSSPQKSPAFTHPLLEELCLAPPILETVQSLHELEKPPSPVAQGPGPPASHQFDIETSPQAQEAASPPSMAPLTPDKTPTLTPSEGSIELVEAIVTAVTPEQDASLEQDVLSEQMPFHRVLSPPIVVQSPVEMEKAPTPPLPPPLVEEESRPAVQEQITPQDIPSLSEATSTKEALRIVVMTRLLCDRQTRAERINPVLLANCSIAQPLETRISTTVEQLMNEVCDGPRHKERVLSFAGFKSALERQFEQQETARLAKIQRLRKEYLALHDKWIQHCAVLDEQSRALVSETETVQPAGRTTRRSAATLGDAVRSDLEMEQIIASLGNDEATDPAHLSLRNLATIPDMVSVTRGRVEYVYDDSNHRVADAGAYYGPRTGIHDWTEDEKRVFLDKFAEHPKQFGAIAEFLPNKSQAQCVAFYYLHKKKMIDFRKVVSQYAPSKRRRRGTGKKKGIIADIQQHDAEVSNSVAGASGSTGASGNGSGSGSGAHASGAGGFVDLLTVPSRVSKSRKAAAQAENGKRSAINPRRLALLQQESTPRSTPTPEPEVSTPTTPTASRSNNRRRRGGQSSQNGTKEGEEDPADTDPRPAKRAKRSRKATKSAASAIVTAAVVAEEPSMTDTSEGKNQDRPPEVSTSRSNSSSISRRKSSQASATSQWTDADKNLFSGLVAQHGDDFKRIAASMPNKTTAQVTQFYTNYHQHQQYTDTERREDGAFPWKYKPVPIPIPGTSFARLANTRTQLLSLSSISRLSRRSGSSASTPTMTPTVEQRQPSSSGGSGGGGGGETVGVTDLDVEALHSIVPLSKVKNGKASSRSRRSGSSASTLTVEQQQQQPQPQQPGGGDGEERPEVSTDAPNKEDGRPTSAGASMSTFGRLAENQRPMYPIPSEGWLKPPPSSSSSSSLSAHFERLLRYAHESRPSSSRFERSLRYAEEAKRRSMLMRQIPATLQNANVPRRSLSSFGRYLLESVPSPSDSEDGASVRISAALDGQARAVWPSSSEREREVPTSDVRSRPDGVQDSSPTTGVRVEEVRKPPLPLPPVECPMPPSPSPSPSPSPPPPPPSPSVISSRRRLLSVAALTGADEPVYPPPSGAASATTVPTSRFYS
ncbi:hypothetical protein APHAL10511_003428 [Amanita phalloides]|nr:hypothetical protein APHAL10511_003428 [Amanita phalloides]